MATLFSRAHSLTTVVTLGAVLAGVANAQGTTYPAQTTTHPVNETRQVASKSSACPSAPSRKTSSTASDTSMTDSTRIAKSASCPKVKRTSSHRTKKTSSGGEVALTSSSSQGTSSVRIPVSKEVAAAPVEAVAPAPAPAPVVVESTTVAVETPAPAPTPEPLPPQLPMPRRSLGNFYVGIGAGGSVPVDNMRNGYGTGWNATGLLGYDWRDIPLGIRLDLGYDRLKGRSSVGVTGDIATYTANLDGKLWLGSFLSHFYGLAGVGASRVVGYGSIYGANATSPTGTYSTTTPPPTVSSTPTNTYNGTYPYGAPGMATSFSDAPTNMNWHAGGGFEFGVGHQSVFIESRYFHVDTKNALGASTKFVPIILGITFH